MVGTQSPQCRGWSDLGGKCLGLQYGAAKCAAHDSSGPNASVACTATPASARPAWCSKDFCYVDAANCATRPHMPATYLYNGLRFAGDRLAYSYATCGDVDSYAEDVGSRLRGMAVRVTVPDVTSPTVHLRAGGMAPAGPAWDFLLYLVRRCRLTSA